VKKIIIYTDGGARGNPGNAGAGAYIVDEDGCVLKQCSQPLGVQTNNFAEYQAVILGLENLKRILAPGGMARIFPIVLAQKTGEDLYKHNFHQKKKALIEAVKGVCGDEHFNAEVVKTAYAGVEARYLLLIQRLK